MAESDIFERISQDLNIARGLHESIELWHCRIAYSAAAVRGLASTWEQDEDCEEKKVSLKHVTSTIEQTLMSFRKMFSYVEDILESFEVTAEASLPVQIRDILLNAGSFYHGAWHAAPAVPACAFERGISFFRGLQPGKICPMCGAGYYRKGPSKKTNRDIFSMFKLQLLLSEKELERLGESLNEERQSSLDGREFLCLDPCRLHQGYWKKTPDKNVLSLMRRTEGNRAYTLYRFDGNLFHCRSLPEYWNEHSRYATLAAALLAQRGLSLFRVVHGESLVYVRPGYILPPAEDAFFRLYSWPDFNTVQKTRSYFAPRVMARPIYNAFYGIMSHLGYKFEEIF